MDTETLDSLKKELFNIEFKIRLSKKGNDNDTVHKLMRERYIIKQKYDLISKEVANSDGQISFGFADQIDIEQLKERGKAND